MQRSPQGNDPFKVCPTVCWWDTEETLQRAAGSTTHSFEQRWRSLWNWGLEALWNDSPTGEAPDPQHALPLTQSVGLAAARADGQDGSVAPQLLLGGFAVRGALLRQAPQQVRPAGTTGIYLSNSSALHSSACQWVTDKTQTSQALPHTSSHTKGVLGFYPL